MRLLTWDFDGNFRLETFDDARARPKYAILSHTWGSDNEEVIYQDITTGSGKHKIGHEKLNFSRTRAIKGGLNFVWIDTCCIDKTSSSELAEAINSMFRWYKESEVCYVYLTDVKVSNSTKDLEVSRWFTRGWTLQELIAPSRVEFFDRDGTSLGNRKVLKGLISMRTRIAESLLEGRAPLDSFNFSERMAWAAGRQTKRGEDLAYCLVGIFGISMSMQYGEGQETAVRRLRKKIKKREDELQQLAQSAPRWSTVGGITQGVPVLATEQDEFPLILAKGTNNLIYYRRDGPINQQTVARGYSEKQLQSTKWTCLSEKIMPTGLAVIVSHSEKIDVFSIDEDSWCYFREFKGSSWSSWFRVNGEQVRDGICAVRRTDNEQYLVARTLLNDLVMWRWFSADEDGNDWWSLMSAGDSKITGSPQAVALLKGSARMAIFCRDKENGIVFKTFEGDGAVLLPWRRLGGTTIDDVVCVSDNQHQVHILIRGPTNTILHKFGIILQDSIVWKPGELEWDVLGGCAISKPAAAMAKDGKIVVAIQSPNNKVMLKEWNGLWWSEWRSIGGNITGDLVVNFVNGEELRIYAKTERFTLVKYESPSETKKNRLDED